MRILGVDPGYAIVGLGVVEYNGTSFKTLDYGAITTAADTKFSLRLKEIFNKLTYVINLYKPDNMAIEKLYFADNKKTAINVSQARGVILLAAELAEIPIFEYTPIQIKQSVTGYGRADKLQIMDMTKRILKLDKMPKFDDTADALAVAIAHSHANSSKIAQGGRNVL